MNNKGAVKIFSFLLVFMFAISFASAFTIDNLTIEDTKITINPFGYKKIIISPITKEQINKNDFMLKEETEYPVIRLSKTFLWMETDKIAEYKITENTKVCGEDCFMEGKAVLYENGKLFDDKKFIDLVYEKETTLSSSKYFIRKPVHSTYEEVCIFDITLDKEVCYEKEIKGVPNEWVEYNYEEKELGEYEWRLEGQKGFYEIIDAIPVNGLEFEEWAEWGAGGTITHDGDFTIHTFLVNGTFNASSEGNISLLIVAGGGGGGANYGGGGGAGGLIFNNSFPIEPFTNYDIIIGNGGEGAGAAAGLSFRGGNSSFGNIVAIGGGGGAGEGDAGTIGGSGGGGAYNSVPSAGTPGQGFVGGVGINGCGGGGACGGGGGGHNSSGVAATTSSAGDGGGGFNSTINGSLVCYSGGGGGGPDDRNGDVGGLATCGGGRGGNNARPAANGIDRTGAGGGGNAGTLTTYPGGDGGDGIVIIRYLTSLLVSIDLNSPIPDFNSTAQNITFNCSTFTPVLNLSLFIDNNINLTIFNTTSNQNLSIFETIDINEGNHNWTCLGCDLENNCASPPERDFTIHFTAPTINITEPVGIINQFILGDNQTLLWQVTESGQNLTEHIVNCSYIYNGIETQVSLDDCLNVNTTSFLYVQGVNNLTFNVIDDFGIVGSDFTSWNYLLLELNQTFNTPVIELSDENFELNVQASETITQVLLNYNGTNFVSNILSLGGGLNKITTTIQIPSFDVNSNVTFFYNISTSSVSGIITQEQMQEVRILNVGNCTAFSNLLMNLSLFDEKTLESINGTIEFDLEILNPSDDSILNKLSTIFEDISTVSVCADLNLSAGNYIYSLELRYFSNAFNSSNFLHVPEFYHIQKADISGLPQIINLYDLAVNESTEFTISYRDDNYLARENVLLQIQRKYVAEGIFRVIEIPITSSEGQAVGHFDLNNYKYKITVTQDGEVLNVFDNPSIRCESELSGICEINLKGSAPTPSADFVSDLENFFYTITQTNNSVIVDFTIPTGESKLVNIEMVQTSAFTDPIIICNQSILSSAGQIECEITPSIGDSSVDINIVSDGTPKGLLKATFQEDLNASFLLNNYFIGAIMLMTLILMFVSSPQLMIGASVFGLVFLGMIFLLKSSTVGLGLGAIAWLIVSSVIILSKLNKKAEQ